MSNKHRNEFNFEIEYYYHLTKQDFIFSNKATHRISRHLMFWLVFGLITTIQTIGDPLTGFISPGSIHRAVLSTISYFPFFLISVYVFTSILFPLLKRKKYIQVFIGLVFLIILGIIIDYYATIIYLQSVTANKYSFPQYLLITNNLVWYSIILGGIALGIKLAKNWYQQKNENLLLAQQKARSELKLLKARIHPDFLFKTLDNIYNKINSGSGEPALLILKLSEILSYQLYESEEEIVPLENELNSIKNFIDVSNSTTPGHPIALKIGGDTQHLFITPLLLLTFIHNVFPEITEFRNQGLKIWIIISLTNDFLNLTVSFNDIRKMEIVNKLEAFFLSEEQRINLLFAANNCIAQLKRIKNNEELSLKISLTRIGREQNQTKMELHENL